MYSGYNLNKISTKSPGSYLTSDSPCAATAAFIRGDVVAWRGLANSDQGIYYTTIFSDSTAGLSWSPQYQVPDAGTSVGPALACFKPPGDEFPNLYLAWKGQGDDTRIFVANASGVQSDSALALSPGRPGPSPAGTNASPALAATEDALFMAWKGVAEGSTIWWSQSQDGLHWSRQTAIPQVGDTSDAPALAAIGNTLFLAWKGKSGDESIFWAKCSDGKTWQNHGSISGGSGCGPGLAALSDGRLCLEPD